ncbi:MAG: hypothetical protein KTR25_01160 [Myxococcales bacterium]|nr:hypothetical protein [Myxococcales bacterium]
MTTVNLIVGDSLSYSLKKIEVTAGSTVKLTLTHQGRMPKTAMGHNWVLLSNGTNANRFLNTAMRAAKTDYIPESLKDSVIAHTKVIGGGESDIIEFKAPAAGEYTFVCSFPGHGIVMTGKLIAK